MAGNVKYDNFFISVTIENSERKSFNSHVISSSLFVILLSEIRHMEASEHVVGVGWLQVVSLNWDSLGNWRYFYFFEFSQNVLRSAKEEVWIFRVKVEGWYVFTLIYSFLAIVGLE